ncbi:GAF and ANTAR domain-containing protein [Streptomyces rishiriensis]|uniref:GAF domain-containing protein n=1 Tax=Streptomyces rishiriensis TaxID=68264 RepID=A0ABU0NYS8_STRRH|nr:GAF and ANTAR domain-containing protein [Streptomyces rishiriensis]MDQ0584295.1 GAF domain-containing protein [Streptomyces rishiriensis]
MSLLTDTPSRQLLCASDATALRLEEIQFTVAEGPCIAAAASGTPVLVEDLREELPRWPFFSASTAEQLPEVRAVYALPLRLDDETLGSMNLLRRREGGLDAPAVREAQQVADAVVEALLSTHTELLTGSAAPAWEPADVIRSHWSSTHQAIGVVAARLGISISDALAHMRAEAFRTGQTLAEITAAVLNRPPRK